MMTMTTQEEINYTRIAEAIDHIQKVYREQPTLDQLADMSNMSPFHFQRLFTTWAGVSPKKFMQYLSLQHAKKVLKESKATLFDAAYEAGLSGTGRLHDLFVSIEAMTPGEYKNGGKNLEISYSIAESRFGRMLISSTIKGVCHVAFCENEQAGLDSLKHRFPHAKLTLQVKKEHQQVVNFFNQDWSEQNQINLHLAGTPFQLKVWETLLRIPAGNMTTYGHLAAKIEKPGASRAVGTAIGANPIALIIPCHRVIQSSGHFGGYMWGNTRKQAILGWEGTKYAP